MSEQVLVRSLPDGTKQRLRERGAREGRSIEGEARAILTGALDAEPRTIVDFLAMPESAQITFEPERLGITARKIDF